MNNWKFQRMQEHLQAADAPAKKALEKDTKQKGQGFVQKSGEYKNVKESLQAAWAILATHISGNGQSKDKHRKHQNKAELDAEEEAEEKVLSICKAAFRTASAAWAAHVQIAFPDEYGRNEL